MSDNSRTVTSRWFALRVGGEYYETTTETVKRSTFLCSLTSGKWSDGLVESSQSKTENSLQVFRIDRCGRLFKHVLRYLIDPNYVYPHEESCEAYLRELDYYGIDPPVEEMEEAPLVKSPTFEEKIDFLYSHLRKKYCTNGGCKNEAIPYFFCCVDCCKLMVCELQKINCGVLIKLDERPHIYYVKNIQFTGDYTAVISLMQYFNGRWVPASHASEKNKITRYRIDHPSIVVIDK